jgi:hypothetical protein
MNEQILVWLHDIQKAILEIESFYASTSKSFHVFNANLMLRKAIERNFILVGSGKQNFGKRTRFLNYKCPENNWF